MIPIEVEQEGFTKAIASLIWESASPAVRQHFADRFLMEMCQRPIPEDVAQFLPFWKDAIDAELAKSVGPRAATIQAQIKKAWEAFAGERESEVRAELLDYVRSQVLDSAKEKACNLATVLVKESQKGLTEKVMAGIAATLEVEGKALGADMAKTFKRQLADPTNPVRDWALGVMQDAIRTHAIAQVARTGPALNNLAERAAGIESGEVADLTAVSANPPRLRIARPAVGMKPRKPPHDDAEEDDELS